MEKLTEGRHVISAEWIQPLVMITTVSGLFLWNHHEMHLNQKETRTCIYAIHEEMQQFHGKLCALEEKNKK